MLSHYVRRPVGASVAASNVSRLNHTSPAHFEALEARRALAESRWQARNDEALAEEALADIAPSDISPNDISANDISPNDIVRIS